MCIKCTQNDKYVLLILYVYISIIFNIKEYFAKKKVGLRSWPQVLITTGNTERKFWSIYFLTIFMVHTKFNWSEIVKLHKILEPSILELSLDFISSQKWHWLSKFDLWGHWRLWMTSNTENPLACITPGGNVLYEGKKSSLGVIINMWPLMTSDDLIYI